jgi:hypothetical protein
MVKEKYEHKFEDLRSKQKNYWPRKKGIKRN